MAVYGWPGSTLKIFVGGEVARDFSVPIPELPPGMDMKGFVGFMFSQPPTEGAAENETGTGSDNN